MTTTRNTGTAPAGGGERPLSARSVVLSTLLGMRPPRLPTRILVRSGALFGIAEGTTRVALSRMVAADELVADGDGYALAGRLLVRQARQDLSRSGTTRAWRGAWRTEVVTADARSAAERASLRAAATSVRLAELRPGVWLRPENLPARTLPDAEALVAAQCRRFASRPDDDPADLAASLWDLAAWADGAHRLRRGLARVVGALEDLDTSALADGFVLSAATLRHLQADPLLPAALLPRDWPGAPLRHDYERYDVAFKATWRTWYRNQT